MILLVDTNILLDVLQERHPHYEHSSRIWNLVEQKKLVGCVSAISFNNIFYVLRKQIGAAKALDGVKLVRAAFQLVPLDEAVLDRAFGISQADFEDAIQASTALSAKADHIITRNVKDFAAMGVSAITAEELLALLR